MHMPEKPVRRKQCARSTWALLFVSVGGLLLSVAVSWRDADGQIRAPGFPPRSPNAQEPTVGVYLPTDRTVSRAVTRARERLAQREFHEALQFLHGLLGRNEDWFFDDVAGDAAHLGVKATARQLIGELPPEGHDAYELLYGAAARRQLEAAVLSGNRLAMSQVVRQFFHTKAGYEAALLLAQMEADQGNRLAAAQLYQDLMNTPRAAALFDPQLSVMAAANDLGAGNDEAAIKKLKSLIERSPSAEVSIAGKKVVLPSAGSDLVAWLTQHAGQPTVTTNGAVEWLTAHGGPPRNAHKSGGRPHLRARWQARVVNDPTTEAYLDGRAQDFAQRGIVVIPSARPIAVENLVVMRTPENLVALDFETGKRIWETRPDENLDDDEELNRLAGGAANDQWNGQSNPLEERVWDDSLLMSLSSDGERVFSLRDVPRSQEEQVMAWRMGPAFGRMNANATATTNQLCAYDIATQGKLVWELDGSRTPAPLDGAFFLGAPLAIDNTLYVMAEIRSAVYLFALDPATGAVQWQQQLVQLEQSVGLDPIRRRAGATPSYDAGILVCPTSAGAVIGIDVVRREFAWVYRYPPKPTPHGDMRNIWQSQVDTPTIRANDKWLDNLAVIGDGHVFVTPPDAAELHCIDLHTGKQAWKRRQGDSLFVAGVHDGRVLLVGTDSISSLKVSDGSAAWQRETVSLPKGSLPAGQGYMSEGRYYLPLTTGKIAEVSAADGELAVHPSPQRDALLGNLICYRGSILSQSALVLDKYEQLAVLQDRVESALTKDADDATALRELAELKRNNGETAEAVSLLKRVVELADGDALAREMLCEVLLECLATDFERYRGDLPLLRQLVRDRTQQVELRRVEASGFDNLGQRLPAFDAYLQLADFTAEAAANLRIEPDYAVRSDRWICGRLLQLWTDASENERRQMRARLVERRPRLDHPRTSAELRHYLAHTDGLPGSSDVRAALAGFLIEHERFLEADMEVLQLRAGEQDAIPAAANLTKQLIAGATGRSGDKKPSAWPTGHVNSEFIAVTGNNAAQARNIRNQAERQAGYRALRIEQDLSLEAAPVDWFVASDCTELIARNGLGDDVFQHSVEQNNLSRQFRDSKFVHGARLGRLMLVAIGGQIMAIHAPDGHFGSAGEVLWKTDPFHRYSTEVSLSRRASSEPATRTNRRPIYHAWSGRSRINGGLSIGVGALGPVTPRGVVFQEQEETKCVDPVNGELLWSRTDIPAGCELFGDMEYVFAADLSKRTVHVLRMTDGSRIGERKLPKQEWLLTVGRNVAEVGFQMSRQNRRLSVQITDVFSGETLYAGEFPIASRVAVLEPHLIGIYDPSGKFQMIDVRNGEVTIDEQLEAMSDVQGITVMQSGDRLFLMVSAQANQQYKPLVQQPDFPMVNGLVYAFDRATGRLAWPAPAVVRNRGIMLSQPQDVPLMVFTDRKLVRDPATGGGSQLRVLCLDQRTGETVYRNDSLADTSVTRFRIRGERGASDGRVVAIEMNAGKIQLTMTDRPRPPQPPGNDDLEMQRESSERGLRRIGERMTGALQGALENAAEREKLRQMELIERARRQQEKLQQQQLERFRKQADEPAAEEVEPQTDDD